MKNKSIKEWEKELKEMKTDEFYNLVCAVNNIMIDFNNMPMYKTEK